MILLIPIAPILCTPAYHQSSKSLFLIACWTFPRERHITSKIHHAPNSSHILPFYLHYPTLISQNSIYYDVLLLFIYDKALFSYWSLKLLKAVNYVCVHLCNPPCILFKSLYEVSTKKIFAVQHCFQKFKTK